MTLRTPAYFHHYGTPYTLVTPPGGGLAGYRLDNKTGRFVEDNDKIDAMHSVAEEEGRGRLSRDEGRLKMALYRRTHKMWEDEFARRDAGEPPTSQYTSVLSR